MGSPEHLSNAGTAVTHSRTAQVPAWVITPTALVGRPQAAPRLSAAWCRLAAQVMSTRWRSQQSPGSGQLRPFFCPESSDLGTLGEGTRPLLPVVTDYVGVDADLLSGFHTSPPPSGTSDGRHLLWRISAGSRAQLDNVRAPPGSERSLPTRRLNARDHRWGRVKARFGVRSSGRLMSSAVAFRPRQSSSIAFGDANIGRRHRLTTTIAGTFDSSARTGCAAGHWLFEY